MYGSSQADWTTLSFDHGYDLKGLRKPQYMSKGSLLLWDEVWSVASAIMDNK